MDKRIFQSPQSTAAWPPYGSIPMGRPPLGSASGIKRQQAVDAFAMQQGRDQGQQPYPIQPLPARAYSFDKAKSSESQPYFANGHQHDPKLYPEDSDNKSNKSRGNVSAFSEGDIYATCGQTMPGTLGSIRTPQALNPLNLHDQEQFYPPSHQGAPIGSLMAHSIFQPQNTESRW